MVISRPLRQLPLLLVASCAFEDAPCPNGPMTEGDAGLIVTEEEHPTGFGQENCLGCHSLAVLHDSDCTPWVDTEALREEVAERVESEGSIACTDCHGSNGVTP